MTTIDLSPGDMLVRCAATVLPGERIVAYLEDLGRWSGQVVRVGPDGAFAVVADSSPQKRERMAEALTALINSAPGATFCDRRFARRHVEDSRMDAAAVLTFPDGSRMPVDVADLSLVGAIVRCRVRPPIGAVVALGGVPGKVARYTPDGFAVDFDSRRQADA